jgi:hypothetical protein
LGTHRHFHVTSALALIREMMSGKRYKTAMGIED